jgi:hypothetical protein
MFKKTHKKREESPFEPKKADKDRNVFVRNSINIRKILKNRYFP